MDLPQLDHLKLHLQRMNFSTEKRTKKIALEKYRYPEEQRQ
jgi:hypothetical protein